MKKIFLLLMFVVIFSANVSAFNDTLTHQELSKFAIDESGIHQYLQNNLNIPNGIDTEFGKKTVRKWIVEGSQLEDEPACRANNHFHDPDNTLQLAWLKSGLSDRWWLTDWVCGDHRRKEK